MRTTLQALLDAGTPIIADGGMGTQLFAAGLDLGDSPELWNVEHPDMVRSIHRAYVEAGAQIILTNTFGGTRLRMDLHKLGDRVSELNQAAAKLAIDVAEAADRPVVVAGDIGPSGGILMPYGEMSFEEARDAFAEQAAALVEGGVDVLWIETMSDLEEVRAAVEGARSASPDMPLVTTMTFDTNGRTMFGVTPQQAYEALKKHNVLALGGNCGNGIEEIVKVIEQMGAINTDMPLIAKANAGVPHLENGVPVYDATPDDMVDYAAQVCDLGASIIGACCGSTPEHIRRISETLAAHKAHAH